MTFSSIITLILAVGALSCKPGPGMMAILSRTLSQGMQGCLAFMAGVNLVNMGFLSLVLMGLVLARDDLIFISILIKSLAAVYLIWIGVKGLQNPSFEINPKEGKAESLFDTFTGAVMLTLGNPLVILFFAGILPTVLNIEEIGYADMVIVAAIIIAVETGVAVLYCLPMAYSRNFFTPELTRQMNILSSIVIIIVGLYIGYSALPAEDLKIVFF